MRTRNLLLSAAIALALTAVSAKGESRSERRTAVANPITIESEVHDIAMSGDDVILHLYREPYDIVAPKWLPVRTFDGCRIYAVDLREKDNIHLYGDLDHTVIYARHIKLQRRDVHLGGDLTPRSLPNPDKATRSSATNFALAPRSGGFTRK